MTDFTRINLPTNDAVPPLELMIDGFSLNGFSLSDANRVVQVFQAAISKEWVARGGQFHHDANIRIDDLNLTLDVEAFKTPNRLGRALASQLMRKIF